MEKSIFFENNACANVATMLKRKNIKNCLRKMIIHAKKNSQTRRNFDRNLKISRFFWFFFWKKILPQKIRVHQRCGYAQKKALDKLHKNYHNSWNKKIPDEAKFWSESSHSVFGFVNWKLWNVIANEWLNRNRFQIQYSNTLSTSFRLSLFLALNSKFWNRAIWLVEN